MVWRARNIAQPSHVSHTGGQCTKEVSSQAVMWYEVRLGLA